ncbi:MAG: DoxX family membrane protein [Halobacteriales archaeon]|nr:DoxX family membrane protein [Halobacteriales archaeon]
MHLDRAKRPLRYVMAFVYVVAGIAHFIAPKAFARAVPPQLPRPVGLVYLSGVAELLFGIGVLFERTRRPSAWGLVALLGAVFPANVHLARSDTLDSLVPERYAGVARVAAWIRLPLQPVLMAWAWWYTRERHEATS